MSRIQLLPDYLAHKIAAGEVVERPVSVVKELVENSIDALATEIEIEIKDGGKEYIRVSDNGSGIHYDDFDLLFVPHATSKISSVEELFSISSLGFRGEALASIASISDLLLKSRLRDNIKGYQINVSDDIPDPQIKPVGMAPGTTVEVRRLFYNTPARYKYLKQSATEKRHIISFVSNISLAHPQISFKLVADEKLVLISHGDGKVRDTLSSIYDQHTAKNMIELSEKVEWGTVGGFISPPNTTRNNRSGQLIILNGRIIKSPLITSSVEKAYQGMLPSKQFPLFLLSISIDPSIVDVNVHPTKQEVRFQDEQNIYQEIISVCKQTLLSQDLSSEFVQKQFQKKQKPKTQPIQEQLEMSKHFPWQPKTWSKVDQFLAKSLSYTEPIDKPQPLKVIEPEATSIPIKEIQPRYNPVDYGKENHNVKDQLLNGRIIGQFRLTYILLETDTGLWLLDQHIIHERILYEKLIKQDEQIVVQQIIAQTLEFNANDALLVEANLESINGLGIELEEFGHNRFLLRGIPNYLGKNETFGEVEILELISDLNHDVNWREKAAITLSCKGAIKAGQRLTDQQIHNLLAQLAKTENPFTCPHGRPIIVKLEDQEILRRFGR